MPEGAIKLMNSEVGESPLDLLESNAAIASFVSSFEDCSLPRSQWTHEKHLIMALWYVWHYPKEFAKYKIRAGIQRYNRSQGNLTGYHETITLAWICVIELFLSQCDRAENMPSLAKSLLATCGSKDYLFRFYSRAVLLSEDARRRWVPPDLCPFS
jgi:hypothetical protein